MVCPVGIWPAPCIVHGSWLDYYTCNMDLTTQVRVRQRPDRHCAYASSILFICYTRVVNFQRCAIIFVLVRMTGLIRGHQDRDYGEIPGPPTSLNKTRRCCAPRLPGDFSASNDLFAPAAPSPTPLDVSTKQQFKVTKTSSSFVRFCLSHQNELPVT